MDDRYDVLIVPGKPGFRLSEQGVAALVRFLGVSQLLVLRERVSGEGWIELYFAPDLFAHHLFVEDAVAGDGPALDEAVLRYGTAPCTVPYGDQAGQPTYVYFELVGAAFPHVTEELRDRLQQMLYLRPQVSARPFMPLPHVPSADSTVSREQVRARRAAVTVEDLDPLSAPEPPGR
ncbi:MAG: hypothetical protein EP329_27235 [Deltaproteobacteria bacterium]|nr:MAG: hypothetical protein EP329_27235 [Deltaproteobacteria bacterium]